VAPVLFERSEFTCGDRRRAPQSLAGRAFFGSFLLRMTKMNKAKSEKDSKANGKPLFEWSKYFGAFALY